MGKFIQDLISKFTIQILYLLLIAAYRWGRSFIERRHPLFKPLSLGLIAILFLISSLVSFYTVPDYFVITFILTFGILCYVIISELNVLWKLGILGADRAIAKGINYQKALKMCTDSFDFLGIGASKLVGVRDDFRLAVARCNRDDRPLRFLLCPPDHPNLLLVARRAGRPEAEYQATVKKSLSELRYLKKEKNFNIEIRFYSDLPLFRLMFINDNLCLASHYILGEGDGSQLPQLHILKRPIGKRDIDSIYYPLNRYFKKMWDEGVIWDFEKYI